jgi:hypothetical protein
MAYNKSNYGYKIYITIPIFEGVNYYEKSLNFVKSIPAYQEQCKK